MNPKKHRIVSISLEQGLFEKIEAARAARGIRSRSSFWRKAAHEYLSEISRTPSGRFEGVLVIIHANRGALITKIKHEFERPVKTHIHQHLARTHECLELFLLEGKGEEVRTIVDRLRRDRGITYVKLIASDH